jgi:hypothetical protein
MKLWLALLLFVLCCSQAFAQEHPSDNTPFKMEIPASVRAWYRNPDGSCVQCSIGMCGIWSNVPEAATLLWDSEYGPKVRGGSGPSRVEAYAELRKIPVYNVTGQGTWEWMRWAARTRRMAAIGAGRSHYQTLYSWEPASDTWGVCNNNSTSKVDRYTWEEFKRLHLSSGQWIVVIDRPPPAPVPQYAAWWQ